MAQVAIFVGTVYGAAQFVAEEIAEQLNQAGHQARLYMEASLDDFTDPTHDAYLIVTSTTGQGDIPDNLLPLYAALQERFPLLEGKPYGVIALGDSSYGDTFCGAGRQWQALMEELQGRQLEEMLTIDATETMEPEAEARPWLERWLSKL